MMIARWRIDARFGHKQTVIDSLKRWNADIGSQIGWTADKVRVVSGSVGVRESTIEIDIQIADLAELNASWAKLATIEQHKRWSQDLEPHIVSGSTYWEILRVI